MVAYIHEEDMLSIHCQKFDGGLAMKGKGLVGIPRISRKVNFVFCSFRLRLNIRRGVSGLILQPPRGLVGHYLCTTRRDDCERHLHRFFFLITGVPKPQKYAK